MINSISLNPTILHLKPLTARNTLFLDRDGVLNHAIIRGNEISSPRCLEEFKVVSDIDALASPYIRENWNLVIITNQPDLNRGWIDMQLLKRFHDEITQHISLNAIYLCPHLRIDNCACRKPASGLIQCFREDHPHLDGREMLIGDGINDQRCAKAAKIPFVLRQRHYNRDLIEKSEFVIRDLKEIEKLVRKES